MAQNSSGAPRSWSSEGKPLKAAAKIPQGESTGAQQHGYDANVFGFRDGIVNAHGIRRG